MPRSRSTASVSRPGAGAGSSHAAGGRAELRGDPDLTHRLAGAVRVGRVEDHPAGEVVRVGGGLRRSEHGGGADVGLVQQREPLLRGAGPEDGGQFVAQAGAGGGVVVVLQRDQVLPIDRGAEVGEELRLDRAQAEPAAVGGAVDVVVGRAAVEHVAPRREVRADREVRRHRGGQQRQHAVRHREVDVLPAARVLARDDRRQDREGGHQAPAREVGQEVERMAGRPGPSGPGASLPDAASAPVVAM